MTIQVSKQIKSPIGVIRSIEARYTAAKTTRSSYETLWNEINSFLQPGMPDFSIALAEGKKGEQVRQNILDNSAEQAKIVFVSGLMTMLVNPAAKWFALQAAVSSQLKDAAELANLNTNVESLKYFDSAERSLLNIYEAPSTGFRTSANQWASSIASIGNAAMSVQYDVHKGFMYRALNMNDVFWDVDENNSIVHTFHRVKMSYRQAALRFGIENMHPTVIKAITEADAKMSDASTASDPASEKSLTVVQATVLKREFIALKDVKDGDSKPFMTVFLDETHNFAIQEGEYSSQPIICSRWSVEPGEIYGRGPGAVALNDIKLLQRQQKIFQDASRRAGAPAFDVEKGAYDRPLDLAADGVNLRNRGRNPAQPLQVSGNIAVTLEAIQATQRRINDAFFKDVMALSGELPQMTATEVIARTQDRMRIVSPMVANLENEWKTPMISRTFQLASENGFLPDPTESLDGLPIRVVSVSPVIAALKATNVNGFERFLGIIGAAAQFDPSVKEAINWGAAITDIAEGIDIPMHVIRSVDEANSRIDAAKDLENRKTANDAEAAGAQADKMSAEASGMVPGGNV